MRDAFFVSHVFFEEGSPTKWIAIVAILATILLAACWPRVTGWVERRARRR
jgi:hypothetical protein